jgi:carboxypeptidase D
MPGRFQSRATTLRDKCSSFFSPPSMSLSIPSQYGSTAVRAAALWKHLCRRMASSCGAGACTTQKTTHMLGSILQTCSGKYPSCLFLLQAHLFRVEYPIGLGFSTGNVTANSEEETAADFIGFFKNFQQIFGISKFKIYVTGESYAGRYVPYVSSAIIDMNDTTHFDLGGALMYDPVIGQYDYIQNTIPAYPYIKEYSLFFNFNNTFMKNLEAAHSDCGYASYIDKYLQFPPPGVQPALYGVYNTSNPSCDVWDLAHNTAFLSNPCFNSYEINLQCPILFDSLGFPTDLVYGYSAFGGPYFNRTDVKKAIHAPQDVNWAECGGPVFKGSDPGPYNNQDKSLDPIQHVLPKVVDATQRVLVSNGDFDFIIITNGTLLAIQNMTWGGQLGFQKAPSTPIDIKLPDLKYQQTFIDNGLDGLDGPGQGIMGVQHYERGKCFLNVSVIWLWS